MALTARQLAAQRKALRRELERDAKRKDRERLAKLRELVKAAKQHKRDRLKEIVTLCQRARAKNREGARAIRAAHRQAAQLEIEARRINSRKECNRRKLQAKHKGLDSITRAAKQLAAERRHQETMRRYEAPAKVTGSTRRTRPKTRKATALQETEADVLRNIPPELVPVWRKVRGKIKGTPRRSRTEAFLEWAAEHKAQVYEITDAEIEKDVARLAKEEKQLRREYEDRRFYQRQRDRELARRRELAPVPF